MDLLPSFDDEIVHGHKRIVEGEEFVEVFDDDIHTRVLDPTPHTGEGPQKSQEGAFREMKSLIASLIRCVSVNEKFHEPPLHCNNNQESDTREEQPSVDSTSTARKAPHQGPPAKQASKHPVADVPKSLKPLLALANDIVATCLAVAPDGCTDTVLDDFIHATKLNACTQRAAKLKMGSVEQLGALRQAYAEASAVKECESPRQRLLAVELQLRLLSWETDGGAMVLMQANPLLAKLGRLYKEVPHLNITAVALAGAFWSGLATRLCNVDHLDHIDQLTAKWSLSPAHRRMLTMLKALTASELEAVQLLASPTSPRGQWARSPKIFVAKIKTLFVTLKMLEDRGYRTDDVNFLATEVRAAGKELLQELDPESFQEPAQMAAAESDGGAGMDDVQVSIKELRKAVEGQSSVSHQRPTPLQWMMFMMIQERPRDELPKQVTTALQEFQTAGKTNFSSTTDLQWDLWLDEVKESESFLSRVKCPTYRGRPGFSLYRDRYIRLLKHFAKMFTAHMINIEIRRRLRDTPCLWDIVRDTTLPDVWPRAILSAYPR